MPKRPDQDKFDELRASTEEELDALELNAQDDDEAMDGDEIRDLDDGTGLIGDDVAQERIEELAEVGPDAGDRGAVSVAPGRDDTSWLLRKHRSRSDDVLEANLDEPRDDE